MQNVSRLTFRTVLDGADRPTEYADALDAIEDQFKSKQFDYQMDLMLFVGGDMMHLTDPTGMHSPKVFAQKKRATARIAMNDDDVRNAKEPETFLRDVIYASVKELIERISAKDKDFDKDEALGEIELLKTRMVPGQRYCRAGHLS